MSHYTTTGEDTVIDLGHGYHLTRTPDVLTLRKPPDQDPLRGLARAPGGRFTLIVAACFILIPLALLMIEHAGGPAVVDDPVELLACGALGAACLVLPAISHLDLLPWHVVATRERTGSSFSTDRVLVHRAEELAAAGVPEAGELVSVWLRLSPGRDAIAQIRESAAVAFDLQRERERVLQGGDDVVAELAGRVDAMRVERELLRGSSVGDV